MKSNFCYNLSIKMRNEPEMTTANVSRYLRPQRWIRYDAMAIMDSLIAAKNKDLLVKWYGLLP